MTDKTVVNANNGKEMETVETVETVDLSKATKLEKMKVILDFLATQEAETVLVDTIAHEIALLEKRQATKKKSQTKTGKEREENAQKIQAFFDGIEKDSEEDIAYSNIELGNVLEIENVSSQKITPILQLVTGIEKTTKDKKVAYKKA